MELSRVFNLCRILHAGDVLFEECICTFSSVVIDGRSWMFQLQSSQLSTNLRQESMRTSVPPIKKTNLRTDRAKGNEFKIYGFSQPQTSALAGNTQLAHRDTGMRLFSSSADTRLRSFLSAFGHPQSSGVSRVPPVQVYLIQM